MENDEYGQVSVSQGVCNPVQICVCVCVCVCVGGRGAHLVPAINCTTLSFHFT